MNLGTINWQSIVARYAYPEMRRSLWQVANSVIPFFILWYLAYRSLEVGYWLTLLLTVPAAGFMVRMFILFHDCCHGSFFKTKLANDRLGLLLGLAVFTPYYHWKHSHAIHHATAGDLDRRGIGDVYTMTVQEYLAAPWWKKFSYRVMRNPLILFSIGAFIVFVFAHRFWEKSAGRRERNSVIWTDIALLGFIGWTVYHIGWQAYLLVEVPILLMACGAGVWLFYIQHNFEPTYWARHEDWEFYRACMDGSSYYKLPKVLQWFTGNIGFHHIHHLSPKIPNYKLEQCLLENPVFQVKPLTIRKSLRSLSFRLWDEKRKMLVGWNALRKYKLEPQKI
jgi:omega-6 fatty acid desaturase (delta-12 desaturase)